MKYLIASDMATALAKSQAAWDSIRPSKNPEDVTRYLWGVADNGDGTATILVDSLEAVLSAKDRSSLTTAEPKVLTDKLAAGKI